MVRAMKVTSVNTRIRTQRDEPRASARAASRRPKPVVVSGAALTVLAALVVARAFAQGPGPMPVVVAPVTERDVPASIRLVGTIFADKTATVASEVSGLVAEFTAQEGQFLKAGDVICRLDSEVARLRLAEAVADLERRRAELAEYEHGERPEELRRLEAAVSEAEALYEKAKFERDRVAGLYAQQQANPKEKNDADLEFIAAERRLAQARASLEKARTWPRAEQRAQVRYQVAAQEAVTRRFERDVQKSEIRAPFDGFVVSKKVEKGEWIDAGGAVCGMIAVETVKIRTDVPENAISFARAGAPASVEVEALSRSYAAKIARVIPQATAAARTFPVEIDLPNADHTLLPGMFVWAHVPAGPPGQRLMVTKDAIVSRGTSKQLFVIRPGPQGAQMAVPTAVTTGLEVAGEVEVQAEGIRAGDLVVCRANERLFGPTSVIPQPLGASPTTQPSDRAAPPASNHAAQASGETKP